MSTQQELEQPAKVYQLMATDAKVDTALQKLDTLLTQTSGLVTGIQLDSAKKEATDYTDEEIKKVHLIYGPVKKNASKFMWMVVAEGVAILGALVIVFITAGGK